MYFSLSSKIFDKYRVSYQNIKGDLNAWKFKCDKASVISLYNNDFILYRKKDIAEYLITQIFCGVGDGDVQLTHKVDLQDVGLFYNNAKVTKIV